VGEPSFVNVESAAQRFILTHLHEAPELSLESLTLTGNLYVQNGVDHENKNNGKEYTPYRRLSAIVENDTVYQFVRTEK
jgi:hypothetical protein